MNNCKFRAYSVPHALAGLAIVLLLLTGSLAEGAAPAVVLNEIHYHPVENAAFNADGSPFLDLSDDVHEFVELYNFGLTTVPLGGWRLSGDVDYEFPTNAVIVPAGYVVIAKNPARLLAISQYALTATNVFGPYQKNLGNHSGSVRLRDSSDNLIDSVSYSSGFPWAIGADALGADDEWTGLASADYQYRGRSLERVSATWAANDPANWLGSPASGNPSPGRPNAVTRVVPKPIVIAQAAYQESGGVALIRSNQPVRIDCTFSATNVLSSVTVEYFVDDINLLNETRTGVSMTATGTVGGGHYTVVLPGRPDRTLVRYRFRANRGSGLETVSPRADDPFGWHAYFVTPTRTSPNQIYECFISSASLTKLATNIGSSSSTNWENRRITQPNPPGYPRTSWNATEPAVFVANGEVFDIRMRHHASQYHRDPVQNSFKWQFPRYHDFEGREGVYAASKNEDWVAGAALFRAANLPISHTRWMDLYLNNNPLLVRLEQDEMDDSLASRWADEQHQANPGTPREAAGEFIKSQGIFMFEDPAGPYGYGGFKRLPAVLPWWTERSRYEWTYSLQMHGWKGYGPFADFLQGMWAARGDTPTAVGPNLPALRAYLAANCDVDEVLTYMAIRSWSGVWDDFNHNWFLWHRADGRWGALPWDFDFELGGIEAQGAGSQSSGSIYLGEYGVATPYHIQTWVSANWFKDSFYKAFREEYRQKMYLLNNTLLNPTNITALGLGTFRSYADARFANINAQLGFGAFQRPRTPTNLFPAGQQAALPPAQFVTSAYSHSANPAPAQRSTTWWIRSSDGSYSSPVFKRTSTTNLTTLPIPFELLKFGQTYYWKSVHTDTNNHASLESAETKFIYGAQPTFSPLIPLDAATLWRYNARGTNQPATWRTNGFDDSLWLQGAALFGTNLGPLPEPIRTPLTLGARVTTYFRKSFNFAGDPGSSFLRLRYIVDDGAVFYLNGVEIHRIGMASPPGSNVFNGTLAGRAVTDPVYEGPVDVFPTNLIAGVNVLAAEVHRSSTISTDVIFGLVLEAAGPPTTGSVVLNEILADNRSGILNGGTHPDYIELYNTTAVPQNLNGLSLSDDAAAPGKYIFPPGAMIPPLGHLVVWCDDETNAPGMHSGFALDNDGQTVALFTVTPTGFSLLDSVTFGLQIPDQSVSRFPDGSGPWILTAATPGGDSVPASLGSASSLKVNEWMASDAGGPDWLELYNPEPLPVSLGGLYLTDDLAVPTKSRIPSLSFIGPGGYRQFIADQDPNQGARHANFKLGGSGEMIAVVDPYGAAIDTVTFDLQTTGVSQGRLPDGAAAIVSFPGSASPEEPNHVPLHSIVINEVLSHSDPPLQDAIEFYNPTETPVDISGWWLSDDKFVPRKYQMPLNSVVEAGGFLVVYENQFNASPGGAGSFAFSSAHGDGAYLSASDGSGEVTGFRTGVTFDAAENGISFGRFETSQGSVFTALDHPTFGAVNATAKVGPVVISEIMYRPADLPGGLDNARDEFIELRNIASVAVPLFGPGSPTNHWRLRGAVKFTFPPAVTLAPGETVLVVGFDPAADVAAMNGFLDTHGLISARVFGPWLGKLDNSGDSVELVKPDLAVAEPGPDFGFVPAILVDRVKYSDNLPWPPAADGSGFSLMRLVSGAYGNDPTNWFAWVPTTGLSNFYNALPVVSLTSPANGSVFSGPASIPISATASDSDGSVVRVDFYDGTNKIGQAAAAPFGFVWNNAAFGVHTITAKARDNGNGTASSLPVTIRIASRPPVVTITSPSPGAIYTASNPVPLSATAIDPDTAVAKVEYFVDAAKVAESAVAPYLTNWNALGGIHQLKAVATDISGVSGTSAPVNISVQATAYSDVIIIASNSVWKYLDNGSDQGTAWTNLFFADSGWNSGMAELGYGDSTEVPPRPEATIISFGPNSAAKYITYYFRQQFVVGSVEEITGATLRLMRDDGALAWLNGVEVFRNNLPTGPVTSLTQALTAINGADEYTFIPTNVSPTRLVAGTNILAVEIHQQLPGSSDVSFAAELRVTRQRLGPAIVTPPANRIVSAGDSANFSVIAIGSAPLSYQWYYNGSLMPGETGPVLSLPQVQTSQAGGYSVVIGNPVATITSGPAALAVGDSDFDGDGLSDAWEIAHGLNALDASDRLSDLDGDGMSNYAEFIAGTDPADAQSYLRIDSFAIGRAVVLSFAADANRAYTIEKNDALGIAPWTALAELAPAAVAGMRRFADAGTITSRFYRLATSQTPVTPLRVESFAVGSAAVLTFNAVSNRVYVIEYTDNLGTGPWSELFRTPSRPVTQSIRVADPAVTSSRVYRLVIPAVP
ncbi:MAG: hypothetical protein QOF48_3953 [Verrucomicrobiota bacterium]